MVNKRSRLVTPHGIAAVATVLLRLRYVLFIIGFAAVAWFIFLLANPEASSAEALLPLSLGLWVALALGIGYTLTRAPPGVAPGDGLGRRIRIRLLQGGYGIVVLGVVVLGAMAVLLTLRAFDLAT
jgi:hypothetical protein